MIEIVRLSGELKKSMKKMWKAIPEPPPTKKFFTILMGFMLSAAAPPTSESGRTTPIAPKTAAVMTMDLHDGEKNKRNVLISHMVVFMFEENHLLTSRVSSRCHLFGLWRRPRVQLLRIALLLVAFFGSGGS